jgi:DNA mismatch repair ATPase MutS
MLNLFSFFKQQASAFRQDNKHRTPDYLAGGLDALREAGDCLTAQKDVVDLEWITNQLHAQEKEARELRTLNKSLIESRRTFQSKSDLQAKEIVRLKEQLAVKQAKAEPIDKQVKTDFLSELGSLRHRIKELEALLRGEGITPAPDALNLQNTITELRRELDKEKGIARAGTHVTSLPRLLKTLRRIMGYGHYTAELKMAYVQRAIDCSQAVLDGKEPEDWLDKPEPSLTAA